MVSEAFAKKNGLRNDVKIAGQAITTDPAGVIESKNPIQLVGWDMARAAAQQAYEQAGIGPQDIDVVELHDCFAHNELISYEALGLCGEGEGEKFVLDGDNTYGGLITLVSDSTVSSNSGLLTLSNTIDGAGKNLTVQGNSNTLISGAITTGSTSVSISARLV